MILQMDAAGNRYTFCSAAGARPFKELLPLRDSSPFRLTQEDLEAGETLFKEMLVPAASAVASESLISRLVKVAERGIQSTAKYTRPLAAPEQILFNAATAIAGISGSYTGYRLEYSDQKRFDNLMVITVLDDPMQWKGIANLYIARRNLDQAQENIRVLEKVDREAPLATFHVHEQTRLSQLKEKIDRESKQVDELLGHT